MNRWTYLQDGRERSRAPRAAQAVLDDAVPMNLFGEDLSRVGTCELCGAECWVINGVATHTDGWRDDECEPAATDVKT